MKTFQFLLHVSGIAIEFGDGDDSKAIGFYTARRAKGATPELAFKALRSALEADPKVSEIMDSARASGLTPRLEVDEVHPVPWWRALLPWRDPGLAFYPADDDELG